MPGCVCVCAYKYVFVPGLPCSHACVMLLASVASVKLLARVSSVMLLASVASVKLPARVASVMLLASVASVPGLSCL